MKKISYLFLLMMSVVSLGLASCGDDDDEKAIVESQLPGEAKTFLARYFDGVDVLRTFVDTEHSTVEYDVTLANGFEITFNANGEWIDVDAPAGVTIPAGIAPEKIAEYVEVNFSGYGINEIAKEPYGYDVELTNGLDLAFDNNGVLLRVDR